MSSVRVVIVRVHVSAPVYFFWPYAGRPCFIGYHLGVHKVTIGGVSHSTLFAVRDRHCGFVTPRVNDLDELAGFLSSVGSVVDLSPRFPGCPIILNVNGVVVLWYVHVDGLEVRGNDAFEAAEPISVIARRLRVPVLPLRAPIAVVRAISVSIPGGRAIHLRGGGRLPIPAVVGGVPALLGNLFFRGHAGRRVVFLVIYAVRGSEWQPWAILLARGGPVEALACRRAPHFPLGNAIFFGLLNASAAASLPVPFRQRKATAVVFARRVVLPFCILASNNGVFVAVVREIVWAETRLCQRAIGFRLGLFVRPPASPIVFVFNIGRCIWARCVARSCLAVWNMEIHHLLGLLPHVTHLIVPPHHQCIRTVRAVRRAHLAAFAPVVTVVFALLPHVFLFNARARFVHWKWQMLYVCGGVLVRNVICANGYVTIVAIHYALASKTSVFLSRLVVRAPCHTGPYAGVFVGNFARSLWAIRIRGTVVNVFFLCKVVVGVFVP